ncbi:MAG: GNAT family N-acetyltransferase [Pyrinomonadaceae bacterium]
MEIRNIDRSEIGSVVQLMREFAAFEDLAEYCTITPAKLDDSVFGDSCFVECVVAVDERELIGYAIFYPHFASFRGQTGYYLEDIFLTDGYRRKGVGELIIRHIAKLAIARGFERIDFQVLDWNTHAVEFYQRLGAERDDSERHFKFAGDAFRSLAR